MHYVDYVDHDHTQGEDQQRRATVANGAPSLSSSRSSSALATNSTSSSTLPTHSGLTSNQFEALIPDRYLEQGVPGKTC